MKNINKYCQLGFSVMVEDVEDVLITGDAGEVDQVHLLIGDLGGLIYGMLPPVAQ